MSRDFEPPATTARSPWTHPKDTRGVAMAGEMRSNQAGHDGVGCVCGLRGRLAAFLEERESVDGYRGPILPALRTLLDDAADDAGVPPRRGADPMSDLTTQRVNSLLMLLAQETHRMHAVAQGGGGDIPDLSPWRTDDRSEWAGRLQASYMKKVEPYRPALTAWVEVVEHG